MRKILIVVVLVVASAFLLTGCADIIKTPQEDEFVEEWLASVENGDYAKYYGGIAGVSTEEEYVEAMKGLDDYYNGDIVDIKKTSAYIKTYTQNGQTTYSKELQYQIETTQDDYTLAIVFVSEDGVEYKPYYYNIIYSSELKGNGAVINFDDFDIVQLLLLILSVLSFGFMVFSIVLCAKSKVRLKGLWIPIIVIVQSGFTISRFPESFSFNINFIATTISSLRKFLNGGTILTVMLPIGAILFVILRKTLIRRAQEYRERKAFIEQQAAEQSNGEIEVSMDELKDE
jgi:hypothetical protein